MKTYWLEDNHVQTKPRQEMYESRRIWRLPKINAGFLTHPTIILANTNPAVVQLKAEISSK